QIDDRVACGPRIGLHGLDQRHSIPGDDIRQPHGPRSEGGKVYAQPLRQGRVDVGYAPVLICRKEASRCMVEMVDRLLKIEEEAFLLCAFLGYVGKLPRKQWLTLAGHGEGACRHAVPVRARFGTWPNCVGKAEFAVSRLAVAKPGSQSVDNGRSFRHVRKQRLDRLEISR